MAIVTQALAECSIEDVSHASVAALRGWLNDQDDRLVELGELLRDANYRFTTITPTSHAQNLRRRWDEQTCTLHNVFGWNRPFPHGALPEPYLSLLRRSGSLQQCGDRYMSTVRFSTLSDLVLMHSAYPTTSVDSVFFGPDTYRFAREIIRALSTFATAPSVIADIGCGSGAGGLVASSFLGAGPRFLLTDINRNALRVAAINTLINHVRGVELTCGDALAATTSCCDFIVSNPPYLADKSQRTYRDGGGKWGIDLSVRVAVEGMSRLMPGGLLLLYTGTPVVDGTDLLLQDLQLSLPRQASFSRCSFAYEELDCDVFGEELAGAPYDRADRIAVVICKLRRER